MSINTYGTRVETKDWIDRVQANGGSLTGTQIAAGEHLIQAGFDGGWYGKMFRLMLYMADLNVSRVPLICAKGRSPAVNSGFTDADVTANGLKGDGSSSLDLQLILSNVRAEENVFLTAYVSELVAGGSYIMGAGDGTNILSLSSVSNTFVGRAYNFTDNQGQKSVNDDTGTLMLSRDSATNMRVQINESAAVASAGTIGSNPARTIYSHALNDNGSVSLPCTHTLGALAVGHSLTSTQMNHFMQTMNYVQQTILGRP